MTTESGVRMARDSTEFQHKAILALDAEGFPRAAMADLLGISLRSIRRYLNTPCPAYAEEMAERDKREEEVERLRPIRAVTPFLDEEEEAAAMSAPRVCRKVSAKARRVRELLDAGRTQAEISRQTGLPKQTVSRIAKNLPAISVQAG